MEPNAQPVAAIQRETRSSIELTRNAKGDYQWAVKAYFEEGNEEDALAMLETVDQTLRAVYLGAPLATVAA